MGVLADLYRQELDKLVSRGEIEATGNLKFYRFESGDRPCVKAWRGKSSKPFANYYFKTTGSREQWICSQIERDQQAEQAKTQARLERAKQEARELAIMRELIQVGTLLHYSWGWEQTNCDYYQVVARKGDTVTIRAIASEYDPTRGAGGSSMSAYYRPVRDSFLDGAMAETLTKRIRPYGLKMAHGHATPTQDGISHYCSWYA